MSLFCNSVIQQTFGTCATNSSRYVLCAHCM